MQKKHNIHTIAEVLIDKLGDMEHTASRIEKAAKTPINVNLKSLRELFAEHRESIEKERREITSALAKQTSEERETLREIRVLKEKNQTRVPNWVLGILFVFFLSAVGSMWYAYDSIKRVKELEEQNQFYEREFKK